MSESYHHSVLLEKVDAIRCNVEEILKVVRPMKHALQELERLREKYGDDFKLVDHPENYLEPEDWETLLKETLTDFEDVKEPVTKIGLIMALKCKQHAEKVTPYMKQDDYEESQKANSLWRNYEQFHKFGAMMNDFVFTLEGHANHPPE